MPVGLSGTAEDHASLPAGIAVGLRASDRALAVDGLLADRRATSCHGSRVRDSDLGRPSRSFLGKQP